MTKEEKIQEAWGEHYEVFKEFISDNGWVDFKKAYGDRGLMLSLKNIPLEVMDNYDPKYCYWKRPFSLSGIENNNGWIKINNKEDLPKEGTVNHVFWNNEIIIVEMLEGHSKEKAFKEWNDKGFTYFRPIEKPKPPIY